MSQPTGRAFDPDGAAQPGSGVFGLPFGREQASIVLIPVPFDATTSYGGGTSAGPEAIHTASAQVDLLDHQFGRVFEAGIFMEEAPEWIGALSASARAAALPIIEKGGAEAGDEARVREVDAACERVRAHVLDRASAALREGRTPGVVGGDHSTPLGAIQACASLGGGPLGVLQIDAHMDLRDAYEGFAFSHASIMHNMLASTPGVERLVQVGIRDYGAGELASARGHGGRVVTHFDLDLQRAVLDGRRWSELCVQMVSSLPERVYVSFDIDGLDPSLCPGTGTPVPGGLSFVQACVLLETLARSGRRVVGFDLNEVCPAPGRDDEWDANVGARVLYKLCGTAATTRAKR